MRSLGRTGLALLALGVALLPTTAVAEVEGPQISFSPHAGAAIWKTSDIDLAEDLLLGARIGVSPSAWFGLEGTVDFTPTHLTSDDTSIYRVTHLGANAIFHLAPYHAVSPYLVGGWSQLHFDAPGNFERMYNGWEAGMGFRFRIAAGNGKQVNLRIDARNIMTKFEQGMFAVEDPSKPQNNVFVAAGIEFALGPAMSDDDQDGVPDRRDHCTATPRRAFVDANGCATDADLDGVADGLDLCANTPGGSLVDDLGCPLDSDRDGVHDGVDECDATPVGTPVDAKGCALDGDADGVIDHHDRCPDTVAGTTVDEHGCPADEDGDGVTDDADKCAGTPAGVDVDANGCPEAKTEQEREFLDTGLLRLDKVYFESGKADLKASSFVALDDVGRILVKWPQLRIEISGHTDSRGGEDLNQRLSEARAQSVFDYLARRFPSISAGQFIVRGYGESRSISTNDTAEGRAQNRRVEFQVLNREMLSR